MSHALGSFQSKVGTASPMTFLEMLIGMCTCSSPLPRAKEAAGTVKGHQAVARVPAEDCPREVRSQL